MLNFKCRYHGIIQILVQLISSSNSNMAAPDVIARCIELQIKSLEEQLRLLREVANVTPEDASLKKTKSKKAPVDPNKPKYSHIPQ